MCCWPETFDVCSRTACRRSTGPCPHPRPPARSFLPHIGRVTIIMNDYPMFKYALIAVLAVFVLTSKE